MLGTAEVRHTFVFFWTFLFASTETTREREAEEQPARADRLLATKGEPRRDEEWRDIVKLIDNGCQNIC